MNQKVYKSLNQGERRLVDWQYNHSSGFVTALMQLICRADDANLLRLNLGFPEETAAIMAYRYEPDYWPDLQKRLGLEG